MANDKKIAFLVAAEGIETGRLVRAVGRPWPTPATSPC